MSRLAHMRSTGVHDIDLDLMRDDAGRYQSPGAAREPASRGHDGGHAMVLANTTICDFGWKARDFSLKGVDGRTYALADVRGPKGTLVTFICNHCPYVKASIGRLVEEAN